MQKVQIFIQLGKTLLHYSRKKDFQSPPKQDFLDVTFNLATEKYFPFWRANNTPLYINAIFNHPSTIIKQLHKMFSKKISDLFCNKEEDDKVKSVYEIALKDSGYFSTMYLNNGNAQNARKKRNKGCIVQPTI